jgi:glycosyltransferase involved in cell wall biosynthesis
VLSTFGFLLPHKGTLQLIEAVDRLRARFPDLLLLAACAEHPDPTSAAYRRQCQTEIERRGLEANVVLVTDFLPEPDAHALLAASDLIVMPYRATDESASGALRFVLGAGRPIAASDVPIFGDARDSLALLTDTSADGLARDIGHLLDDPDHLEVIGERVRTFARSVSWDQIAARHREVYDAVLERHKKGARSALA